MLRKNGFRYSSLFRNTVTIYIIDFTYFVYIYILYLCMVLIQLQIFVNFGVFMDTIQAITLLHTRLLVIKIAKLMNLWHS